MKRKTLIRILFGGVMMLAVQCLDPYSSPSSQSDLWYLVVDGFLNASDGSCNVRLTRSVPLAEQELPPPETGAQVWLESESGIQSALSEITPGVYKGMTSGFGSGTTVKLKVRTNANSNYESDAVQVLQAGELDSVTWRAGRVGVDINVTAHNSSEASPYYYWTFTDTWAYHARYATDYTLNELHEVVPLTENIFECWKSEVSKTILVATSSKLQDDSGIVNEFTLETIPWESPKMQLRYSILVEQRAINKATLDYFELLKKNTENLGTLFDPLPGHPIGNIRCITRPNELVFGNFEASTVKKQRIFFNNRDLPRPDGVLAITGGENCVLLEIRSAKDWEIFWPVNGFMGSLMGTQRNCVDCRRLGGVNVQPDFWIW